MCCRCTIGDRHFSCRDRKDSERERERERERGRGGGGGYGWVEWVESHT